MQKFKTTSKNIGKKLGIFWSQASLSIDSQSKYNVNELPLMTKPDSDLEKRKKS